MGPELFFQEDFLAKNQSPPSPHLSPFGQTEFGNCTALPFYHLLAGYGGEAEGPGAGEGAQGGEGHGEGEQQVGEGQVEDEDVASCPHLL